MHNFQKEMRESKFNDKIVANIMSSILKSYFQMFAFVKTK